MEKKVVSNKSIIVWKLRYTIISCILAFLGGAVAVFSPLLSIIICILGTIIYAFLILYYVFKKYKSISYFTKNKILYINKGVYFKKRILLKFSSIQYIEELQTPLQKLFRTYTLSLYTAGSKVTIGQLDFDDLEQLKNICMEENYVEV